LTKDGSDLEKAARVWAKANPSVPILLRRLGCLREMLAELPGLDHTKRIQRVLDSVMTIATETALAELTDAALTDPLTGVGNRRALENAARVALAEADRAGHLVSVAALDLQGLKQINDTRGHAAGDTVLAGLTASLRAVMRDSDQLFRIGGDEFVALLPFAPGHAVSELMTRAQRFDAPAFSWGVATAPEDGNDLDRLLEVADGRLYEARRKLGYYHDRRARQPAAPSSTAKERRRKPKAVVAFVFLLTLGLVMAAIIGALRPTSAKAHTRSNPPPAHTTPTSGSGGSPTTTTGRGTGAPGGTIPGSSVHPGEVGSVPGSGTGQDATSTTSPTTTTSSGGSLKLPTLPTLPTSPTLPPANGGGIHP
jgi:diguanylate cyclase (GGDEF)-like protein